MRLFNLLLFQLLSIKEVIFISYLTCDKKVQRIIRENHIFISWPNFKLVNQLKNRIPTSLFLLCKVQAIMCKFIMATMYKCKGKGMTTSKCKSKKALLCVSSKLSSWSRKKVKKKNSLCVYQAFEPADQTGACFRIQEKLWEAVFTNL